MRQNAQTNYTAILSILFGCSVLTGCASSRAPTISDETLANSPGAPGDSLQGGESGALPSGTGEGGGNGSESGTGASASSGSNEDGGSGAVGGSSAVGAGGSGGNSDSGTPSSTVLVHLVPAAGISGKERVNLAVPLPAGMLMDASRVRLLLGSAEVPAARRALAKRSDNSIRSVQIQFELDIQGEVDVEVEINATPTTGELSLLPVSDTLLTADGTEGPRVWALLPPTWLSQSDVAGPLVAEKDVANKQFDPWAQNCDYDKYGVESFLPQMSDGTVWLYDRGTVFYRAHARRGDLGTLESAYRETAAYRAGLSFGEHPSIPAPGQDGDLKYYYTQNMAIHYLMTGDDRFREAAEQMGLGMVGMWNPVASGGFWTERHAAFMLLAHVWAMAVSDDKAQEFRALADEEVSAYLDVQAENSPNYSDPNARCFAQEDLCSPWMSAILADALDAYAAERGGSEAAEARDSIVKLGRIIAQEGRDSTGKPYYMMGVGPGNDEVDDYNEHWGESAYLLAMAWHHSGKSDSALFAAATELTDGFAQNMEMPHMRSFNWQCRSAVAASYFLTQ